MWSTSAATNGKRDCSWFRLEWIMMEHEEAATNFESEKFFFHVETFKNDWKFMKWNIFLVSLIHVRSLLRLKGKFVSLRIHGTKLMRKEATVDFRY